MPSLRNASVRGQPLPDLDDTSGDQNNRHLLLTSPGVAAAVIATEKTHKGGFDITLAWSRRHPCCRSCAPSNRFVSDERITSTSHLEREERERLHKPSRSSTSRNPVTAEKEMKQAAHLIQSRDDSFVRRLDSFFSIPCGSKRLMAYLREFSSPDRVIFPHVFSAKPPSSDANLEPMLYKL